VASTNSGLGTPQQTSCLPMHSPMKLTMIKTPNVSATGSATNSADISESPSPYGISQRPLIKSPTGCTLPPEPCLMSITTIAHQAQGICTGEVITKLAEDTYFLRVDNRVTQVPPLRIREHENHEATSRSPVGNGHNRTRGDQPQNPNCTKASAGGPSQGGNSAGNTDRRRRYSRRCQPR
jgi:hypothetical protein